MWIIGWGHATEVEVEYVSVIQSQIQKKKIQSTKIQNEKILECKDIKIKNTLVQKFVPENSLVWIIGCWHATEVKVEYLSLNFHQLYIVIDHYYYHDISSCKISNFNFQCGYGCKSSQGQYIYLQQHLGQLHFDVKIEM